MNQQTFNQIINTGASVSITTELMEAAHESAKRERSHMLACGTRWIRSRASSAGKIVLEGF